MSDRIDALMSDLMNDLYVAFENPAAILDAPVEVEVEDAAPAYALEVPSASSPSGTKTYDATHLSADASRNVALLSLCVRDLLAASSDDAQREGARAMAQAIIATL